MFLLYLFVFDYPFLHFLMILFQGVCLDASPRLLPFCDLQELSEG